LENSTRSQKTRATNLEHWKSENTRTGATMTALAAGTSTCSRIHKLIIEGTRTLAAYFAGTIPQKIVHMQKTCWRVSEIRGYQGRSPCLVSSSCRRAAASETCLFHAKAHTACNTTIAEKRAFVAILSFNRYSAA